jgi:hypothetical protein
MILLRTIKFYEEPDIEMVTFLLLARIAEIKQCFCWLFDFEMYFKDKYKLIALEIE